ncbi:MAG: ATP-dependent RecD-like DNA helicase [Clostridia bacterium]|nr:ATP-dependent RecD-like DNA helicase [Clostridia bacterium]
MKLEGTLRSIIFHNSENGYTVAEVVSSNKRIICVGNLPIVAEGEELELEGEYTFHNKFGQQFAVSGCVIQTPKTVEGVVKYLSSGLIKGLGPVTAKAIATKFRQDTLRIIAEEPNRLAEVKGISAKKAKSIAEQFAKAREMQQQIMFLQGYNISLNLALRVYEVYKGNTEAVVKQNPYVLVDDVEGVGFITADKIAMSMGIPIDSDYRVKSAVVYCMRESADRGGNTFIYEDSVAESVKSLLKLDVPEEKLKVVLDVLSLEQSIKRFEREDKACLCLSKYFNIEKNIAYKLVFTKYTAIAGAKIEDILITHFEELNQISFHIDQKKAIKSAIENGVSVITGGPGTGKTTIIKCICYIFHTLKLDVQCVTPTGRAAKRMQEATGEEAKTIHRVLDLSFKNGIFFTRNEHNPLDADVVIVDEMSMVDAFVFNALLKALKAGARIVLVGDKDQLPSVGAGNVLADIIKSGVIPVCSLSYIYRQSNDSLIVSNAHRINRGEMPTINNQSKDFFFISRTDGEDIAEEVCGLVAKRLPSFVNVAPQGIQVLAPMKAGGGGVERINKLLQERLNPCSDSRRTFTSGNTTYRVGDKVMQTQNDYQMEWQREAENGAIESGEGVFNGDVGFITAVYGGAGLQVTFEDGRIVDYNVADATNLMLAYAVTIHKSQGSEFEAVVIALSSGPPSIINKNLLYTAVTRAKNVVVLVGDYKKHLMRMVKTNYIVERNTMLCEMLQSEQQKSETLYGFKV